MAQPNIVNVASIYGQSVGATLTTSFVAFITVTAEYVVKVNLITVANVDGTNAATCDVCIVKQNATKLVVKCPPTDPPAMVATLTILGFAIGIFP